MQKLSLKKMGIILALTVLTSTQAVEAHSSHHHSHSHSHSHHTLTQAEIAAIWGQISESWHAVVGALNVIFSNFATAGVNSTTESLGESYNAGVIAPETQELSHALHKAGVKKAIANNVETQFNLYALAAENYASVVSSGGTPAEIAAALDAWNTQTTNLIVALEAIKRINPAIIAPLVTQLQQAEIASIIGYNGLNFAQAITNDQLAQSLAEQISDYIAKTVLRI